MGVASVAAAVASAGPTTGATATAAAEAAAVAAPAPASSYAAQTADWATTEAAGATLVSCREQQQQELQMRRPVARATTAFSSGAIAAAAGVAGQVEALMALFGFPVST